MPSIFSKIARNEAPAERLFETEHELAFLDIFPKSPGHTLVVPKLEVANFEDLPPERAATLMQTVQIVARGVTRAMGTPHYNLILNNGAAAGQVVFHVHFHIIPRYAGGSAELAEARSKTLVEIGEQVRTALRDLNPELLGSSRIPRRG
jgi:histidine triad (HIT) family protein